MARPREFNLESTLDTFLEVFWTHGYDGTSMSDLMEATDLSKGSIYKGFGDKKNIFLMALDSYLIKSNLGLRQYVETSSTGKEALTKIISKVIKVATNRGTRKGCFSVNSIIELAPHDPDIRKRLQQNTKETEKTFSEIIKKGISDGTFNKSLNPESAAAYLTTVFSGLHVRGKVGLTKQEAEETVDFIMKVFS